MDGILLIDKPTGPTSFDVVRQTRKKMHLRKVGHAGTLDPLASGLLVVCLGQGTKLVPYLMDGHKRYTAQVTLGVETDTLDADGEIIGRTAVPPLDEATVERALTKFVGTIEQLPPKYSAIKQGGEPLYRKARRGETVTVSPRKVRIDRIDLLRLEADRLVLDVHCQKGTYIRSLARDIAVALGTVGHIAVLRREASSGFTVDDAIPYTHLTSEESNIVDRLVPLADGLPGFPEMILTAPQETAIGYGQSIEIEAAETDDTPVTDTPWRLLTPDRRLVALAERTGNTLKPIRVFPL